jgi:hypothetical protein
MFTKSYAPQVAAGFCFGRGMPTFGVNFENIPDWMVTHDF